MSNSNEKENMSGIDNQGKAACDDVMSPVVTAQERKRQILERRRQQRKDTIRRSQSMESRASLSSGASSFSNIGRLKRPRSIPQLDLNGENDTNDGDEESATSTFGNDDSILAPPSTLNSMTNVSLFTDLTHRGDNSKVSAAEPGHPSLRPNLSMSRRRLSRRSSDVSSRLFSEDAILSNPNAATNNSSGDSERGGTTFPLINQCQLASSLDITTKPPTLFSSPAKKPSKSLFGAVMQLATLTPGRKSSTNAAGLIQTANCAASPTKSKKDDVATVASSSVALLTETPTKKQKGSRVSLREDVIVSTPGNRRFNRFSEKVAASPGGFGLLNMLNGVMSPFVSKESPLKKRYHKSFSISSAPPTPKTPQTEAMDASSNTDSALDAVDRFEEWHEAYLDVAKTQLGVLDWSIKRRLRIECHPGTCLPGRLPNDIAKGFGNSNIKSRAMKSFLLGGSYTDISAPPSSMIDCRVIWDAALMYWQHPAVHPLPGAVLENGSTTAESASTRSRSSGRTKAPKRRRSKREVPSKSSKVTLLNQDEDATTKKGADVDLLNYIRRQGKGLLGGLGEDDDSTGSSNTATIEVLLNHRRHEWQQAFKSLYSTWYEKVQELRSEEESGTPTPPESVAQTYFYSIQKGQVILFRADKHEKKKRKDDENHHSGVTPLIVLSSMSQKLRSQLESKGVHISIFGQSADQEPSLKNSGKNEHDDEEATLQAELEALRKAQADGVTAGADVSVSMNSYRKGGRFDPKNTRKHNHSPASIKGEKDCAAFYKIYLKSYGSITSDKESSLSTLADVPLLVCRKIGPFLHSSLRNLAVTRGKDDNDQASTIEIRGPILPCSLHELTCASAAYMMQDFKKHRSQKEDNDGGTVSIVKEKGNNKTHHEEKDDNDNTTEDNAVSSHYFLLSTQTHEGVGPSSQYVMENGSNGSAWLNVHEPPNHAENKKSLEHSNDDISEDIAESCCCDFHECGRSEIMSMVVWDVARPKAVVYKVDPAPTNNDTT